MEILVAISITIPEYGCCIAVIIIEILFQLGIANMDAIPLQLVIQIVYGFHIVIGCVKFLNIASSLCVFFRNSVSILLKCMKGNVPDLKVLVGLCETELPFRYELYGHCV